MSDDVTPYRTAPCSFTPIGEGEATGGHYTVLHIQPTVARADGAPPTDRDLALAVWASLKGNRFSVSVESLQKLVAKGTECALLVVAPNGEEVCRVGLDP